MDDELTARLDERRMIMDEVALLGPEPAAVAEPEPEHESETQAALKAPTPEPVMRGRFAVYDTPDGGYHLTYQLDGEEEPQHLEFPGMLVALARKRGAMAGGPGGGMAGFAKLFGGQ